MARFFGGVRGLVVRLGVWGFASRPCRRVDSPDMLRGTPVAPGVSTALLVPEAEDVSDVLVVFESTDVIVPDATVGGGGVLVAGREAATPDGVSAPAEVGAAAVFALAPVVPADPGVPVDATFAGIGVGVGVGPVVWVV